MKRHVFTMGGDLNANAALHTIANVGTHKYESARDRAGKVVGEGMMLVASMKVGQGYLAQVGVCTADTALTGLLGMEGGRGHACVWVGGEGYVRGGVGYSHLRSTLPGLALDEDVKDGTGGHVGWARGDVVTVAVDRRGQGPPRLVLLRNGRVVHAREMPAFDGVLHPVFSVYSAEIEVQPNPVIPPYDA